MGKDTYYLNTLAFPDVFKEKEHFLFEKYVLDKIMTFDPQQRSDGSFRKRVVDLNHMMPMPNDLRDEDKSAWKKKNWGCVGPAIDFTINHGEPFISFYTKDAPAFGAVSSFAKNLASQLGERIDHDGEILQYVIASSNLDEQLKGFSFSASGEVKNISDPPPTNDKEKEEERRTTAFAFGVYSEDMPRSFDSKKSYVVDVEVKGQYLNIKGIVEEKETQRKNKGFRLRM